VRQRVELPAIYLTTDHIAKHGSIGELPYEVREVKHVGYRPPSLVH
jgi:hypothetical protein